MSIRRLSAVLVLVSACTSDGITRPPAQSIDEFAAHLEQLRSTSQIPGISVAIAKDQQIVWAKGFGMSNVSSKTPVTPSTSFHLASLTKPFAATIIMQLVEEGRVSLDDPVTKYGISLPSSGTILVRHLLTHTSEGVPGTTFRYNGNRFGELDSVITRTTGQTFARALQDRILQRLQLRNTAPNNLSAASFAVTGMDRVAFEANLAQGYTINGSSAVPTQYPNYFGAAAGLIASASDMATFSMAVDRDMFLQPATKAQMFSASRSTGGDVLPYGLGWFVTEKQGVKIVWHYGLWTAISSLIIKVPERGLTFVVLANTDGLSAPYDITGDLMNSPWAAEFLNAFVFGSAKLP